MAPYYLRIKGERENVKSGNAIHGKRVFQAQKNTDSLFAVDLPESGKTAYTFGVFIIVGGSVSSDISIEGRMYMSGLQTGNLFGTVVDNQGERLPGVTVTLSGTGPSRIQITSAAGQFQFPGLPPGRYTVTAQLEGFRTVSSSNNEITPGRTISIEITTSPAV